MMITVISESVYVEGDPSIGQLAETWKGAQQTRSRSRYLSKRAGEGILAHLYIIILFCN